MDLPLQAQPTDGNELNPAAANGYFGVVNTFAAGPFILQASQNGAATSPFANSDFLTGDILAESTNPGSGAPLFIEWTAPVAGTITFSGDVWYAHSPVDRSQDYSVLFDFGAPLATGTVAWNSGNGRSNPSTFSSSGPLTVVAGDILALELAPTAGQTFGSLSGVNFTVDLTASTQTPEPGTNLLLASGLLGLVAALRRRD
jgi:PEP-CTERM motif